MVGAPMVGAPMVGAPMASMVDPPFPPLGPSELAEAQMEIGRPDFALGSQAAVALEPTEHIPAPRTIGEASARVDALADLRTAPMPTSGIPEPGPTMRVPVPSQDQYAWAPVPASPSVLPSGTQWPPLPEGDAQVGQRLPAIRPGNGGGPPSGWPAVSAPLGDDRFDPPGASYAGGSQADGYADGYIDAGAGVPALAGGDPRSACCQQLDVLGHRAWPASVDDA